MTNLQVTNGFILMDEMQLRSQLPGNGNSLDENYGQADDVRVLQWIGSRK